MSVETEGAGGSEDARCSPRGVVMQVAVVVLINVPVVMYGAALGWVSGASGREQWAGAGDAHLVLGAALTLGAGALGVPLAAAALAAGRKPALIATSMGFFVCWSLKLCGAWGVLAGRVVAGLAGAAAWTLAPLLAKEMCSAGVRGAAGGACVAAHNLGMLLMYVAAAVELRARTVLWCGMAVSVAHVLLYLFVPESPPFLAASGKLKEASRALATLRGTKEPPAHELSELPREQPPTRHLAQLRDMWGDRGRRRALAVCVAAVGGQELCGVLVVLQFAERVLQLAGERRAAALAAALGAAQLAGALFSLYLVERLGRRPLVVWSAAATCVALGASGACVWAGLRGGGAVLALAVLADSAGAQAAPYAVLADMFPYEGGATATLAATAAAHGAAALTAAALPALAAGAGLPAALGAAAALTAGYCLWAALALPETRGKRPDDIYATLRRDNKQKCCSNNADCSAV